MEASPEKVDSSAISPLDHTRDEPMAPMQQRPVDSSITSTQKNKVNSTIDNRGSIPNSNPGGAVKNETLPNNQI